MHRINTRVGKSAYALLGIILAILTLTAFASSPSGVQAHEPSDAPRQTVVSSPTERSAPPLAGGPEPQIGATPPSWAPRAPAPAPVPVPAAPVPMPAAPAPAPGPTAFSPSPGPTAASDMPDRTIRI